MCSFSAVHQIVPAGLPLGRVIAGQVSVQIYACCQHHTQAGIGQSAPSDGQIQFTRLGDQQLGEIVARRFPPVELGKIQIKDLTVRGCIGSPGVWPAAIRFLERTGIDLSPIQTHSFALDDAIKAYDLGKDPTKAVKITLEIA